MHNDNTSLTVGLVVLTTGERSEALANLIRACADQPFDEKTLVANGRDVATPPAPGWDIVRSEQNRGVPGGRSFGLSRSNCDVVVFLDDDSAIPTHGGDLVSAIREVFRDPTIGIVALRVVGTGTNTTLRRWSPTPRRSVPAGITDVPTFPGNGHALRRQTFDEVGGYLAELHFKHEETELAWRTIDNGWRVVFAPHIIVEHPLTTESRHEDALRYSVRNKIWIYRLRQPLPIALLGCLTTVLRHTLRCRNRSDVTALRSGLVEGFGGLPVAREPISWSTVLRLTRTGRPPLF